MGILDQALAALKTAGFRAEEAFPGQQFPAIRAAVAAVHIQEVDGPSQTVTLGVSMVGPGSAGGVSCETQAGKAAKALEGLGAECIQGPCR